MQQIEADELLALMALTRVQLVGNYTTKNLIGYCGSAREVFKQSKQRLLKIPGVGFGTVENILAFNDFKSLEPELDFIANHQIKVAAYYQNDYPYRLKDISDAPVLLFSLGDTDFNINRTIGIVGTRKNTTYGKQFAEKLVEELKPYNVTIISGMAYGIDIIAHKASLKNEIPTIGVVAHGLDRVYPAVHAGVAKQMIKSGGAIVTEHLSGTIPDRENFPKRNRIVAGMIDALVVVETDIKGGSMITAKLAISYDREVAALPGRTEDGYSKGCNYLIKSHQASMIECADDLAKWMNWDLEKRAPEKQFTLPIDLHPDHLEVFGVIREKGRIELDTLLQTVNLSSSRLAFVLLELEFRNLILSLPGKVYQLIR
jgi:DNA processing protein